MPLASKTVHFNNEEDMALLAWAEDYVAEHRYRSFSAFLLDLIIEKCHEDHIQSSSTDQVLQRLDDLEKALVIALENAPVHTVSHTDKRATQELPAMPTDQLTDEDVAGLIGEEVQW